MYWISILQVLHCNCTETTTMSLKHSLIDLHQERPTQCNPGHVSIHFIPQSQSQPHTQFFKKISVGACFSTAVEWARILQTVSNSANSLYHMRCTRHNQVLRNKPFIFGLLERQTWPPSTFLCFGMSCHSSRTQTWPNRTPTRIVHEDSACYEIGGLFTALWGSKDDPLDQFSMCHQIVVNWSHTSQTRTICWSRMVISCVLWLVSNGSLVAEI